MSLYNRRLVLVSGLAALAACGFSPAYAPNGAGDALFNRVLIAAPSTRAGFLLTQELESRLGRGPDARFELTPKITLRSTDSAISDENVAIRVNLLGTVSYTLRDRQTDAIVSQGIVDSFTGYSTSGTPVAVQAAERDAEVRLMQILADQLITRLLAAAAGLPE